MTNKRNTRCNLRTFSFCPFAEEELDSLFPQKTIKCSGSHSPSVKSEEKETTQTNEQKPKSLLSVQIETGPKIPRNLFTQYLRFEATALPMSLKAKLNIFIPTQVEPDKSVPLEVHIKKEATIQELIGLICWRYTQDQRKPQLKPRVDSYCLRISEDNGDVDPDFPSLNQNEVVSKFGFPVLALVETEEDELQNALVGSV